MSIDARIPLMVQQPTSPLDRQMKLSDLAYRQQAMDMQRQRAEQEQAAQQKAQQREQVALTARLLGSVKDEASYQQALAAGRRFGLDTSTAPPSYDPAWVQEHAIIASTLLQPDGEQKLTQMGQELRDAGYVPGTPEFQAEMRKRLAPQAGNGTSFLQELDALGIPRDSQAAKDLFYGRNSPPGYLLRPQGGTAPVEQLPTISTPEEARSLPPGTRFRTPDGRIKVVPGGSGGNAGGNFPTGQ